MTYYNGKTVLLTGAGGALGSLMCEQLLLSGAIVLAVDIHEGALAGRKDDNLHFFQCDLSKSELISALAQTIKKRKFSVDILINNAGIVNGKYLHETTPEAIEKALAINLFAPVLLVRTFFDDLQKNKGHLVDISSAAGIVGVSKLSDYCAAKFGLFGFNEALRVEWKSLKTKISTTVICPYYLQTDMFKGVKSRFSFLLPIMQPQKVVSTILKSVAKKKKRETFLFLIWAVWFIRLFPVALFDLVSSFFGINKSMDEFVGKGGKVKKGVKLKKVAVKEKAAAKKAVKPVKTGIALKKAATKGSAKSAKKSAKKSVRK